MREQLGLPSGFADGHQLVELLFGEVGAVPIDIFVGGNVAKRTLQSVGATVYAVYNPLKDADIFTETGPQEFAILFEEPVDSEDKRSVGTLGTHIEPV